jgi:hypothetical protein
MEGISAGAKLLYQRLSLADKTRVEGNELFKNDRFAEAAVKYDKVRVGGGRTR